MKKLHLIGNAHLDAAWIWPWQEGYGEVKATFLSALQRLNEYEGFVFTSSSAQYYEWIEENEPELFERVKEQVQNGRWVLCGGWWVQPDCNAPCGESFVRQGLYGQNYFHEKFGITSTVGYNVDSFGHNAGLPQILKKSGMDAYVFLRPGPHEKQLPGRAFHWESPDGSSVVSFRIPTNYCCNIDLQQHLSDCLTLLDKEGAGQQFMCFYGVGNHGGGPTKENIEYLEKKQSELNDVELVFSSPDRYFGELLKSGAPLPSYRGDLLHHATGCYSANSLIKALNRRAENHLLCAERYTVVSELLSRPPCRVDLRHAWKKLLFNQFHDVLAGCSIPEVYDSAAAQLGEAISLAEYAENHALQSISFHVDIPYQEGAQPLVVFNPLPFPVTALVCHEKGSWGNPGIPEHCAVLDSSQNRHAHQFIQLKAQFDERRQLAFLAPLPPLGYETFTIVPTFDEACKSVCPLDTSSHTLENDFVRIRFSETSGCPDSIYDKQNKVELLSGEACAPVIFEDFSDTWGHERSRYDEKPGRFTLKSIHKLDDGPVLQRILVTSVYGNSELTQQFTLQNNSHSLFVEARLCWQQPQKCLKLEFPLSLKNPEAAYEIPFGHSVRESDGCENPMQSWIDVTGKSLRNGCTYGMGLLNDGKCGVSVDGARIRMTVLRSPIYAHHAPHEPKGAAETYRYLDQGQQVFHYIIVPHAGGWREARIPQKAMQLNLPATKGAETFHRGELPRRFSGIDVSKDNIVVTALKKAHKTDGYILRAYEQNGEKTDVSISLPLMNKTIRAVFSPYELKTFLIRPKETPAIIETNLIELDRQQYEKG